MAERIGYYSPETAKLVLEVVNYLKQSGFVIDRPGRGEQKFTPRAPIFIRNDCGEEIPPFGCVQVTDAIDDGGQNYITVQKANSADPGGYLFNGIAPIEIDGYGIAHDGPVVRVLTDGTTIAAGEAWQPVDGEFFVEPGGSLLSAIGPDDIATDVMRAFVGVPSTGGGFTRIEFLIDSATTVADSSSPFDGLRQLTVTIISPSCNSPELWDTSAIVYEHLPDCLTIDETDEELEGRKGWAYEGVYQDQSSGAAPGDLTPCHFVLDGLCCPS